MAAQIQKLQAQSLKQEQQQAAAKGLRNGMKQPLSDHGFNDINVVVSQKWKTLIELKEKLKKGQVLSKQEQKVLQMLSEDTVPEGGREDAGKENEEDNPLPDPVGRRETNVEFPDKGDPEDEDMLNDVSVNTCTYA